MSERLALPKQFRGEGDLRSIVDRNTRAMLTHINQRMLHLSEDGSLNLFFLPSVILPSITSEGTKIGFFGETPVTRPTVTGSRGANAALASLLTALNNLGLVLDTTTA